MADRLDLPSSPHFSSRAAMIAEDFGPVRVLATEKHSGPTVEVARARRGPKDRRGRGQRGLQIPSRWEIRHKQLIFEAFVVRTSDVVRNAG